MPCSEKHYGQLDIKLANELQSPITNNTFVVGFAFQGKHDDLATAQKAICNDRNPEDNVYSVTSDISEGNLMEENDLENEKLVLREPVNENENIDSDKGGDKDSKMPEIKTDCVIVKNIPDDSEQLHIVTKIASNKRTKEVSKKKINKCKNIINIKSTHNRNKYNQHTKKKLGQCLAEMSFDTNLNDITNKINSIALTKIISGSTIKDNFNKNNQESLESSESVPKSDSLAASFISANDSFYSFATQNILTFDKSSTSSKNDGDLSCNGSVGSVIHVSPEKPYKSDVINVSSATINRKAYRNEQVEKGRSYIIIPIEECLTSTETVTIKLDDLTSGPLSAESSQANTCVRSASSTSDTSIGTLTEGEKALITSDSENAFLNTKMSSYFRANCESSSDITVKISHPNTSIKPNSATSDMYLLNPNTSTVLNLGMSPGITPPNPHEYQNNVVIAEKRNHNQLYTEPKMVTTEPNIYVEPNSVINKHLDAEPNMTVKVKTGIKLPNEATIKEILEAKEKNENVTCAEEFRNRHPSDTPEFWDKLLAVLESTATRIEEKISEKIIGELQKSLRILDTFIKTTDVEEGGGSNKTLAAISKKSADADTKSMVLSEGLQCCLVCNETFDEQLGHCVRKDIKVDIPTTSYQKTLLDDEFKISKPRCVKEVTEREDTVKLSLESVNVFVKTLKNFSDATRLSVVRYFLKENIFVVTGVPIFMVVLITVYLIIILIVRFI